MSHRRKKRPPANGRDAQSKKTDAQTAHKIESGAIPTATNPKADEYDGDSETEHKEPWYRRWYRDVLNFFEANSVTAFATAFLAVIGIGSLVETKWSLDESRRSFEISQRPYVSLGRKDGIIAEIVEPKAPAPPDALIGLNIYLKNGGRGPALTPNLGIMIGATFLAKGASSKYAVQPRPEQLQSLLRWKTTKDNIVHSSIDTSPILADSEFVHYAPSQFTQEQATALLKNERLTILMGRFEYCDEFGNYFCRQFELAREGEPFNRFVELSGFDCTTWYQYPPRQPDQIYLPPCEQPDEREAREKAEREREITLAGKAPLASLTPTSTPAATPKNTDE